MWFGAVIVSAYGLLFLVAMLILLVALCQLHLGTGPNYGGPVPTMAAATWPRPQLELIVTADGHVGCDSCIQQSSEAYRALSASCRRKVCAKQPDLGHALVLHAGAVSKKSLLKQRSFTGQTAHCCVPASITSGTMPRVMCSVGHSTPNPAMHLGFQRGNYGQPVSVAELQAARSALQVSNGALQVTP